MRYEIKVEDNKKYKQFYVTVGELVETGKSAVDGVKKMSKKIKSLSNDLKKSKKSENEIQAEIKDTAYKAALETVGYFGETLWTMLNSVEEFRKVVKLVDALTPIIKTLARTSGCFFSPGNVAEIGRIALALGEQVLIEIALSSLVYLKDLVWAYEIPLPKFPIGSINVAAIENMQETIEENKPEEIINGGSDSDLSESDKNSQNNEKKEILNDIKRLFNANNNIDTKKIKNYFKFNGRLFYSENNEGIKYSEDEGETWLDTNVTEGLFKTFGKLELTDSTILLAGSTYYITKLKDTSDTKFSVDTKGRFNKDYYNNNDNKFHKLTKIEKNKLQKEKSFNEIINNKEALEKFEFENAKGIYYSEDEGITWTQSNIDSDDIELFFNFPSTVVASSYDYKGIYYSEDGKNWLRPTENDSPIVEGRWINFDYSDSDNKRLRIKPINIKSNIKNIRINSLVNIKSSPINIKVNHSIVQGNELKNYKIYQAYITDVIKAIYNFDPSKIYTYDQIFWKNKINQIKNGSYTIEDAKNGKELD